MRPAGPPLPDPPENGKRGEKPGRQRRQLFGGMSARISLVVAPIAIMNRPKRNAIERPTRYNATTGVIHGTGQNLDARPDQTCLKCVPAGHLFTAEHTPSHSDVQKNDTTAEVGHCEFLPLSIDKGQHKNITRGVAQLDESLRSCGSAQGREGRTQKGASFHGSPASA